MEALVEQLAEYFIMMAMGAVLVKAGIVRSEESGTLSAVAVYLVLPCVIIEAFQIDCTPEKIRGLVLAFAAAIGVHAFLALFIHVCEKPFRLNAIEKSSIMYTNSGNMIIPLITAMMGNDWVLYSSAFITVQLVLIWTHCRMMLCEDERFDIKKILLNINVIAIIVGILLFAFKIHIPGVVSNVLSSVGAMLAPMGMLILGMLFVSLDFRKIFADKRVYVITAFRMVVTPVIILALLKVSGICDLVPDGGKILLITYLASIMPVSTSITQLAQVYGKDVEYASALNMMTTAVSIVTIPVLTFLYEVVFGLG